MQLCVFYETLKRNIKKRRIESRIAWADKHFIECLRAKKRPSIIVAYEHVRTALKSEIVQTTVEHWFEEFNEDKTGNLQTTTTSSNQHYMNDVSGIPGFENDFENVDELAPLG